MDSTTLSIEIVGHQWKNSSSFVCRSTNIIEFKFSWHRHESTHFVSRSSFFSIELIYLVFRFPNAQSLYLLLSHGRQWLDVNSMDSHRNTPLHVHCQNQPDPKIVRILLHFGAHLDSMNSDRRTIVDIVRQKPTILSVVQPIVVPLNLKCLCAHLILKANLTEKFLDENFSTSFKHFLLLHGTVN